MVSVRLMAQSAQSLSVKIYLNLKLNKKLSISGVGKYAGQPNCVALDNQDMFDYWSDLAINIQ